MISLLISALYSFLAWMYYRKKKQETCTIFRKERLNKLIWVCLVSGIGIAFCNQANTYLSGAMDSMIFFPVVNGGSMLITTCVGLIFYKEKLSAKQWVGLLFGVVSIVLLCNIF